MQPRKIAQSQWQKPWTEFWRFYGPRNSTLLSWEPKMKTRTPVTWLEA